MRFARQMLRRLAGRGPRIDDAIVVDGRVIPYRSLVEELPAMVYVRAAQDGFANVYVSPFSGQLTGYTPAEWRNDVKMFQKVLHPDDRDMLALEESSQGRLSPPARSSASGHAAATSRRSHRTPRLATVPRRNARLETDRV
jgi:hypothetical protein